MTNPDFDVIVIGSGITGGWAAKELCERGFKTLVLERGPAVEHGRYPTENSAPWQMPFRGLGDPAALQRDYGNAAPYISGLTEYAQQYYVRDSDEPYEVSPGSEFHWIRGYQLGGKSLTWGRHVPRFAPQDFAANSVDGFGSPWPISYAELARWYDYVEDFIGVSGQAEGLQHFPDGKYLPPFDLTAVEQHLKRSLESRYPDRRLTVGRTANLTREHRGRAPCMSRLHCQRGCSLGAYFSSLSSTLPAARATGNLTIQTGQIAESFEFDGPGRKVTGLKVIDTQSRSRSTVSARTYFVCGSAFNSVHLLLNSRSEAHPHGLGGDSGVLGRYILDHVMGGYAEGITEDFADSHVQGVRPTPFVIPRFRNIGAPHSAFKRGYFLWGASQRLGWSRGIFSPGVGAGLKDELRRPGPWMVSVNSCGEMLPRPDNRLSLSPRAVDRHGIPQLRITFQFSDNEIAMMRDARQQAVELLRGGGLRVLSSGARLEPGGRLHEMGGARMGADPARSVLNAHNQCHVANNVFVTDGAAMPSGSCYNPSLTYMALTARAADYAGTQMRQHVL